MHTCGNGFSPGESHGQRALAGYSLWGRKELDDRSDLAMVSQVNAFIELYILKRCILLHINYISFIEI